jgi:DNA processing protein
MAACGSASGALSAPFEFLCSIPGISKAFATAVQLTGPARTEHLLQETANQGGVVLLPGDPDFPIRLLSVDPAPVCLFAAGDLTILGRPAVAIVGSRDHTRYGADVCEQVAARAAAAGLVVVSGMARGLDAVAHDAAVRVGGATIGVLGNGLGVIYPAANRRLYEEVRATGLLLTEFGPGERPTAGSFPRRNRIIAGLARATLVVEAADGSGALITARTALDLGRDVLAVPGPITSPKSAGTNRLLRDGAMAFLEMADLLARFPELVPVVKSVAPPGAPPASPQGLVLQALEGGALHVDELSVRLGFPPGTLLGLLGAMEISGLLRQEPGMRFATVRPTFAVGGH